MRIWLDSTKNYMPTRTQHLLDVSEKETVVADAQNTLTEVAPGVWAATSVAYTIFPPTLPAESPPRKSAVSTVTQREKTSLRGFTEVATLALARDGKTLATSGGSSAASALSLWDVDTGKQRKTFSGPRSPGTPRPVLLVTNLKAHRRTQ